MNEFYLHALVFFNSLLPLLLQFFFSLFNIGELCGVLVLVLKLCGYSLNLCFFYVESILWPLSWYAYRKTSHFFTTFFSNVWNLYFFWMFVKYVHFNAFINIFFYLVSFHATKMPFSKLKKKLFIYSVVNKYNLYSELISLMKKCNQEISIFSINSS